MSNLPFPPTSWQEDFENEYQYLRRFFLGRFGSLDPDRRDENTQEALCQVAIVFRGRWRLHGKRTEGRFSIARCVFSRVKSGRSCTRQFGHNADPMDRTFRSTGPKRVTWSYEVRKLLTGALARLTNGSMKY